MTDNNDATDTAGLVRCLYYVREDAPGGYRYRMLRTDGPTASARQPTRFPPDTGDLITLSGETYLVLARAWTPIVYGSKSWLHGAPHPTDGPLLDVVLIPDPGLFADEVE